MIDELHVESVALIRDATLVPAAGLTVLTGETGAGKTALLSACKLLVGERADAGAVREGDDHLLVEGRVYLGPDDVDGHIVRRRVEAAGRGRVEIDGRMASVSELAEKVGSTVDLCGQHEHQRLLSTATHAQMLPRGPCFRTRRSRGVRARRRALSFRCREARAGRLRAQAHRRG